MSAFPHCVLTVCNSLQWCAELVSILSQVWFCTPAANDRLVWPTNSCQFYS